MRALVTGSAGFVGRHMVKALEAKGYDVCGADVQSGLDALDVFRSNETHRFDLIVHCAYWVGGRAAIDGNPLLLAKNLQLDAMMFDWAVRTKQHRVLYFSSSAVYPVSLQQQESLAGPLHESYVDLKQAQEPDANYGWAKLTGERLAKAAAATGLPVHIVRPFSGYGEDQDATYPFPAIVERARQHVDPFEIWGPGTQVRDFIHILDVVGGALAIVDADHREPVNLCTGVSTSLLELAQLCCAATGYEPQFAPKPDAPTGVAYRVGDPTKFFEFYKPRLSIQDGIRRALG